MQHENCSLKKISDWRNFFVSRHDEFERLSCHKKNQSSDFESNVFRSKFFVFRFSSSNVLEQFLPEVGNRYLWLVIELSPQCLLRNANKTQTYRQTYRQTDRKTEKRNRRKDKIWEYIMGNLVLANLKKANKRNIRTKHY